jgi:hypothetical protein
LAYTHNPDTLSYTTCFVDGLRDDICSIVLVQRPSDLDTACTLALLQEEAAEPGRRKKIKKSDGFPFAKPPAAWGALPLPPPPPRPALPPALADMKPPEERRIINKPASMDDKLQSLRVYRCACGLCVRCAEKWQPGDKCAPVLQLHALQQVWTSLIRHHKPIHLRRVKLLSCS